jgi:hypothetical protein
VRHVEGLLPELRWRLIPRERRYPADLGLIQGERIGERRRAFVEYQRDAVAGDPVVVQEP